MSGKANVCRKIEDFTVFNFMIKICNLIKHKPGKGRVNFRKFNNFRDILILCEGGDLDQELHS